MDETMTALSASGSLLERHRGGATAEAFAQRLGLPPADYLAILVEGAPPELVERLGFRLGLSFEQEQALRLAADIDRATPRRRRELAELPLRVVGALADFLAISVADDSVRLIACEPMFCEREPVRATHVILLRPGDSCWRSRLRYRLVLIEGGVALLRRQAGRPAAASLDELIATPGYGPTDPAPTV